MKSLKFTKFKFVNRSKKNTLVLLPGWASDYRIFATLDLEFNYLLPISFSPFDFKRELLKTLKKRGIEKVSLLGHSLGGFVACDFAAKHPNFIEELILIGIRRQYDPEKLAEIKDRLKKNKKAYLYKFYEQCFNDRKKFAYFKNSLLKVYLKEFNLNYLIATLDYLATSEIKPESLKSINRIKIIHGDKDRIAPIEEAAAIKKDLPRAQFITVEDAGHGDVSPYFYSFIHKEL